MLCASRRKYDFDGHAFITFDGWRRAKLCETVREPQT